MLRVIFWLLSLGSEMGGLSFNKLERFMILRIYKIKIFKKHFT